MDQQNTVDVKQGDWGGQGISLVVEKNSATMQFDCANATISSRLRTSKSGKFTATGLWKRSGPGPIRLKFQPKPQEVRFEGEITGKQMKLKITFVETGDVAGEYTLERGKSGRLRRCL